MSGARSFKKETKETNHNIPFVGRLNVDSRLEPTGKSLDQLHRMCILGHGSKLSQGISVARGTF